MAIRLVSIASFAFCLLATVQANGQEPNAEFADLLETPMFNAFFGDRTIPFSKTIKIEVTVAKPFDNGQRGAWGRAVVRATKVDGQVTDESRTMFYVDREGLAKDALASGKRYVLTGKILTGYTSSDRSTYCFRVSDAPERLKSRKAVGTSARVSLVGKTLNQEDQPCLKTSSGVQHLQGMECWRDSLVGKTVQVNGVKTNEAIDVVSWKFTNLGQLVGQEAELVGTMWSMNGHWWFDYEGEKIVVSRVRECPGWDSVRHASRVRVTAHLEKELRPSLDEITTTTFRKLVPHFVLKQGRLVSLSPDVDQYRFAEVYSSTPTFSDGVLDLHLGRAYVYNYMPWMNDALLSYWRNSKLIEEIIRRDSPVTRKVLKMRVQDNKLPFVHRLIYAGILAAVNDDAGREFLRKQADNRQHKNLDSLFWVVGNLHQFPPLVELQSKQVDAGDSDGLETGPDGRVDMVSIADALFGPPKPGRSLGKVDMKWAEVLMISAVADVSAATAGDFGLGSSKQTCASLALLHGSFATLLVRMKSERGIGTLHKLVAEATPKELRKTETPLATLREDILSVLLGTDRPEVVELAKTALKYQEEDAYFRRSLQGYLLRHDRELAVDDLIDSIEQSYAFRALRGLGKDNVEKQLQAKLPKLKGEALRDAQLLLVLLGDDPIKSMLTELKKGKLSRNHLLYQIAQNTSETAVKKISSLLRDAPGDFFNEGEFTNMLAIEHAIQACHIDRSKESIRGLISLLDANLARFDVDETNKKWDLLVAGHLIEVSDVSFGADKAKWEAWFGEKYGEEP